LSSSSRDAGTDIGALCTETMNPVRWMVAGRGAVSWSGRRSRPWSASRRWSFRVAGWGPS